MGTYQTRCYGAVDMMVGNDCRKH